MAIAVASYSAGSGLITASSIVVNAPTGIQSGDLLVAVQTGRGTTPVTPSGWSIAINQSNVSIEYVAIYYKVADSTDASASTFTFSANAADRIAAVMMRVTGYAPNFIVDSTVGEHDSNVGSGTKTFVSTITPDHPGCLVVIGLLAAEEASTTGTVTNYITTPSLSFTEVMDATQESGSVSPITGVAYAIKPDTEQITAYGGSISVGKDDWTVAMALFTPLIDATGTLTHLSVSPTLNAPRGKNGSLGTLTHLESSPTLNNPKGKGTAKVWTDRTKGNTTWTNRTK